MQLSFAVNIICWYTVFLQDGRTALMIAVEKDDLTSLQMLLQAGANTTLKDKVSDRCS